MKAGKDAEEKEDAIFKTPHSHCIDDVYLVSTVAAKLSDIVSPSGVSCGSNMLRSSTSNYILFE